MLYKDKRKQSWLVILTIFSLFFVFLLDAPYAEKNYYVGYSEAVAMKQLMLKAYHPSNQEKKKDELTLTYDEESEDYVEYCEESTSEESLFFMFATHRLRNFMFFIMVGILAFSDITITHSQKFIIEYIHHKAGPKSFALS